MFGIKCILEGAMEIASLEIIVYFKVKYKFLIDRNGRFYKKGCPLQENQRDTDIP